MGIGTAGFMVGQFVRHREFGFGKTEGTDGALISVRFYEGGMCHRFEARALRLGGTLTRMQLTSGTRCTLDGEPCEVAASPRPVVDGNPYVYEIRQADGTLRNAAEDDLELESFQFPEQPLEALVQWFPDKLQMFKARDGVLHKYTKLVQQAGGLRAMLASRIDLRPHQVYVAGAILLDRRQRYILADEVGLGKTIEAGVVIADLIARKPDARVLVLCPGTLTHQWLAELYGKLGLRVGRGGFALLDLHDASKLDLPRRSQVIASMRLAAYEHPKDFTSQPWDLVVVDEVHQILQVKRQYEFVRALSLKTKSLLLLSAMPAQHRETELLKLLALLEPQRFDPDPAHAAEFLQLYRAQPEIRRRAGMLQERVRSLETPPREGEESEYTPADVIQIARRLTDTDPLNRDADLQARVANLKDDDPEMLSAAKLLARDVIEKYRVTRRVLRNRRKRLVDEEQIQKVTRRCERMFYTPSQLELDVHQGVADLLSAVSEAGAPQDHLIPVARVLMHATVLPSALLRVVRALKGARPREIDDTQREWLTTGMPAYSEWDEYLTTLAAAVRQWVDSRALNSLIDAAEMWQDSAAGSERLEQLRDVLENNHDDSRYKVIVFAGFPGVAQEVALYLADKLGKSAVAAFHVAMTQEDKESAVREFRRRTGPWVLVSDETGGEGRNFQFASELFHFDTPWHLSPIEQRIGRLDRLGREHYSDEVVSNVLYAKNTVEHALVTCYHAGIGVYRESISGLEFALRDVEREMIEKVLAGGFDALVGYAETLPRIVAAERVVDEGDAVQDEAMAADAELLRLRKLHYNPDVEKGVEHVVLQYMRNLTSKKSQSVHDDDYPDGIWRFSPSSVTTIDLDMPRNSGGLLDDVTGTFRRWIAQQRPELKLFTVGNSFFDAIINAAEHRRPGRTYAVECLARGPLRWVGFEFIFRVGPDESVLEQFPNCLTRARRAIQQKRISVFVDAGGELPDGATCKVLLEQRLSLPWDQEKKQWWNLEPQHQAALQQLMGASSWSEAVAARMATAEAHARAHYTSRLAAAIEAEQARLERERRDIERSGDASECEQLPALAALEQSMVNWKLELDAAGVLSVNGTLRGRG